MKTVHYRLLAWLALAFLAAPLAAPSARADVVAYLVNVTVRPGYHFANADDALAYGHGICDKVALGRRYAEIMGEVKADFQTADEYQASYLIARRSTNSAPR
jgi:Protein of unknown function (DUF732)